MENYSFWNGVVEDIDDPLKLGRCRVRIIGLHTSDKSMIPTDHLPWATVLQPTTSAATSGVGTSPNGLVCGSWVAGFFLDPPYCQQPLIIGSIPGIPSEKPGKNIGFSDPNEVYPKENYLNESDINKLARNEDIENTVVQTKKSNLESNIEAALNSTLWSEPEVPYNAKYPKNHVLQTESGHIEEFDDTPGNERIHRYHKSGTFEEIHPDGKKVTKIISDNYTIVLENDKVLIKGTKYENINGDDNIRIKGNLNIHIEGDANILVSGNLTSEVKGDYFQKVDGVCAIVSSGNMVLSAPRIDLNPPEISTPSDIF